MKQKAEQIFLAGVQSVLPDRLIRNSLKIGDSTLFVNEKRFNLSDFENVFVLGMGKASALMAKEIENIFGERITGGHVVTKYGHGTELQRISLTEAGHPIPDANGIAGTKKIFEIARNATQNDLVSCLISGGASALLADFPSGASLDDLKRTNELLVTCGADIHEINMVRKHLSHVKGGQLAQAIYPATTIGLILSDVVGDKLDVIASGPTVADTSTFADAMSVVEKYKLPLSAPMARYLERGLSGDVPETPKSSDKIFGRVHNFLIGSNRIALQAAAEKAGNIGLKSHIITDTLQGDVLDVAEYILRIIQNFQQERKPLCLLFGGEPTVHVSGKGLGGRNQHLALYLATRISGRQNIAILCAGTDGTDGPTDAAGAGIDNETVADAAKKNIEPQIFLQNSDSYRFFQRVGGHIITGNTRTNVMDMVVVLMNN